MSLLNRTKNYINKGKWREAALTLSKVKGYASVEVTDFRNRLEARAKI